MATDTFDSAHIPARLSMRVGTTAAGEVTSTDERAARKLVRDPWVEELADMMM